jgi:hypothetical protein
MSFPGPKTESAPWGPTRVRQNKNQTPTILPWPLSCKDFIFNPVEIVDLQELKNPSRTQVQIKAVQLRHPHRGGNEGWQEPSESAQGLTGL